MALSTTGKLTFKVRITASDGRVVTITDTEDEKPNCDQTARARAISVSSIDAGLVTCAEIWLIATNAMS